MQEVTIQGQDHGGNPRLIRLDKHGHVLQSYYFRDITATGRANPTRGAETTVISGDSGHYLDLVAITAANSSSVAVNVDVRTGTGGSIIDTFSINANRTIERTYPLPLPQSEKDQSWTVQVQGSDLSDSPVTVTMIATKNDI